MDTVTIFGQVDEPLRKTIGLLQDNNVRVVIRTERELNLIRIREEKLREEAITAEKRKAISIGKQKATTPSKEKQKAYIGLHQQRNLGVVIHEVCPNVAESLNALSKRNGKEHTSAHENMVLSNATLAQRARRDRERILKQSVAYEMSQRCEGGNPIVNRHPTYLDIRTKSTNAIPSAHDQENDQTTISKATLAQRARRHRDRLLKQSGACQLGQNLEGGNQLLNRRHPTYQQKRTNPTIVTPPAQKRQMVTHTSSFSFSSPSTSVAPQRTWSTPTNQLSPEHIYNDDESVYMPMSSEVHAHVHINRGRHYLGKMDVICPFCSALHWMDEKLSKSSKRRSLFGTCCMQGKVRLPLLRKPPPPLLELYEGNDDRSKSFRNFSRGYNAANAFTSLGASWDPIVLSGRGPTSFTIHGELRHRTGSLIPQPGEDGSYAQLYIYDPHLALEVRALRNPHLRRDVLEIIQCSLTDVNPFVDKFRQAHSILNRLAGTEQHLPAYLRYNSSKDRRRYNLPSADEIAVVIPGDGTKASGIRDIIVHLRGNNELMQISECHPAYLPLHYVLLFPYGELGWEPELKKWDVNNNRPSNDRLTQMQFYSYRIFERPTEYSTILRAGKLFQEFIVDAWAATEQNRLTYYKLNQDKLRAGLYHDLNDVGANDVNPNQIGQRFILPSSFIGSPRHMFEIFQDSMAITRYNHHPDIFLTMTANPNWPEITSSLLPFQKTTDRPDLVARVFELKRKALMKEIEANKVFGSKVAHVYTIEFQKWGLPHMHALLFLEGSDKIRTCAQVDKLICAEFPDPKDEPMLFETVKCCMVHGPCGARNPQAPCMENGKCTKRYPRPFAEETTMDQYGYPIYRRRNDGKVYVGRGHEFDNRDVVPYNAYLSKRFNCHINVEVCAGLRCVKYIHKYIYKGHDRTTMVLGSANEIQQYLDARYIGPPEAAWRIFGHRLHEEVLTVTRLALHLPGMHCVIFNPAESMESILARAGRQMSTLTQFFSWYATHENETPYTYQEFPQHFVWVNNNWTPRERGYAIGRMYFASPHCGERFYLRLLLTVVKGPKSFEFLRTVNNVLYDSFKLACVARGLLEDDDEWIYCLQEAAIMKTGYQLRRLFCVILTQCFPLRPFVLWKQFPVNICDDLAHKIRRLFLISSPSDAQVEDYGLYLLNELLQESGKSLLDFPPMPLPTGNWSEISGNRLILEHRQLQTEAQVGNVQFDIDRLNSGQHTAYNAIVSSVFDNRGIVFFLNGGAGTGKTFLYNTIAQKCRSLGHIVVTVASSGIASLLLTGGRTAHSTFCIPLDVLENSVCAFSKQSLHAELFRETKLLIWDEVPMQHKHCVEAVDRTLRDIRDNEKPFGGITVVLGGDFRQILPVVPRGTREKIVSASLRRSVLWNDIHVLTLDLNMRLNPSDPGNATFAKFLMEVGTDPIEIVHIPPTIRRCEHLKELLSTIYPDLDLPITSTRTYLTERTILSARNEDVNVINAAALDVFSGESFTYLAADSISEDDYMDSSIRNRYPNEYLNSLDPPGIPPFQLDLKVGCPIMLLRNIAPKNGLCNGTRMMVVRCGSRIIEAMILTGEKSGNLEFIPRISLTPSSSEFPFRMTRRQFPVRLAYAMTINKSQGQSVKFVGIDLRTPVFSHGQFYVAFSRCTSFDRVSVLLPPDDINSTVNVVYPEVLL